MTVGYDDTKRTNVTRRVTWDYNYDVGLLCSGALAPLDVQPFCLRLKWLEGKVLKGNFVDTGDVLKGNFAKRLQGLVQGSRNPACFLSCALEVANATRIWAC